MATLIDSSVLIAVERGNLDLSSLLARHGDSEVLLSSITVAELLHGVYRARTVDQRTRRENIIEQWLTDFPVVPFDLAIARVHAPLGAHLAS